jgi:putative nucleotidyltransferase with HDIG domain
MASTMPPVPSSAKRFLPHALVATFVVMVLPALAVSRIDTSSQPWLVVLTVLLAMALSVAAASGAAAIWKRHPGSKDIVFGDLMLWGWIRRVRAERRLDKAREILGLTAVGSEERCAVLEQLGSLLEARDAYTHGHTRRVTRHGEQIAREMDLPAAEVAKVRTAAAIHDVGKLHTPRAILTKPGKLTDEEYEIVKKHPVDGAAMAAEMGDAEITAIVRHHHERLDGTGYPDRLAGSDIPLGSRIIAVADTFDAMTSGRPYRAACKHKKALDVLSQEAGTQLDPVAVAAFLRYYSGKRSVAWSALFIDAPPRLVSWVGGWFQGASAGAAPLGQAIATVGAAAVIGTTLGAPARATEEALRAPLGHRERPSAAHTTSTAGTRAVHPQRNPGAGRRRTAVRQAPRTRAPTHRPLPPTPVRRGSGKQTNVGIPGSKHKGPSGPGGGSPGHAGPGHGGNGNGTGNGNGGQKDNSPKGKAPKELKPPKLPKPPPVTVPKPAKSLPPQAKALKQKAPEA